MDLASKYKGVVGHFFGNENSTSNEDSSTVLVVLLLLLKVQTTKFLVRGALETLVGALSPIEHVKVAKNEVQPALMNTDWLSREADNISLLLSLLSEEDFYVRYYTLQILTALLMNSPNSALKTIKILMMGGSETEPGKDANKLTNKTALVQKKVLDHLLMLGVVSQWAPVDLRCMALWCIGDLISGHPKNLDALSSKVLGEEPQTEPALNSILRIILQTSVVQEFLAADSVFKNFCEKNADGQMMLASTLIPQPHSTTHALLEGDVSMSFGSMLLRGLTLSERDGDLETCCRAASVLSHVLKDNTQCKERVLRIELEVPTPSFGTAELLLHRMVRYLALASSIKNRDETSASHLYIQPLILKLLVTWLVNCPNAVHSFLDSRLNLTNILELVSSTSATVYTRALAATLLGECVVYNKSNDSGKDAFSVVDAISQKLGLTSYYLKFDELQKSFLFSSVKTPEHHTPLARSPTASMAEIEDVDENDATDQKHEDHPVLAKTFDAQFIAFINNLEAEIRQKFIHVYSSPKNEVTVVPAELEQKNTESDKEYIKRLKAFVKKQCSEIQKLLGRNAMLAEDLTKIGGSGQSEQRTSTGFDRVEAETIRIDLQEVSQRIEMLKSEKAQIESDASMYQNLAGKLESDLKSLSDAYNSLEQANYELEKEVSLLKSSGASASPDIEAIKSEAREEALKESEAELNDLLVCLGQEQSKVERLTARLLELGEDVDTLLEGVGDDMELPQDEDDEN
ncbi:hypothetical protein ACFE04_009058 [Oxalis oulophora]